MDEVDVRLSAMASIGQSVWVDALSRSLIESGELRRLVATGVRGLTSNPTIFKEAILGDEAYRTPIRRLLKEGVRDARALYESVTAEDVRDAADLFRDVFEETGGVDGFVSLEVSPELAFDRDGTVAAGITLFRKVGRPNVMIKVPATPPGIAAVEELLVAHVPVNVTLIFSAEQYLEVADAYVRALRRIAASGGDPSRARSVASLFVSRLDTAVDRILSNDDAARKLAGRTAVAHAKRVANLYRQRFGEPFADERRKGCVPQRLLFASTSTKNKDYPDLLYVEPLIGPETVNTMPLATLSALLDHGRVAPTLEEGLAEAEATLAAVEEATLRLQGKRLADIFATLLEEGLAAFSRSYEEGLKGLERAAALAAAP